MHCEEENARLRARIRELEDHTNHGSTLASLKEACEQVDRYRELLRRIRQWDHLDTAGDGPFWKREIDKVLNA